MKKALFIATMAATMAATIPAYAATIPAPAPVRASLCKAIIVDTGRDVVTFMDADGYTWEWTDADDVEPGDFFTLAFDTMGTADITDDAILDITYERLDLWR